MVTDAINIQAFEFSCKTEEVAREVQLEIEYSISVRINQIVSSVLQKNIGPYTHLKIDKIEIDLGDIYLEDFGNAEMLLEFEEQFTQKIIDFKQDKNTGETNGKAGTTSSEFELIRSLLLHGDVPWWADKNSVIPVDAILQKLIKLYPQSFKQFLLEHQEKPGVLMRIAEQCKPSTRLMVEHLIPGITAYKSKSLFSEHPEKLHLRRLSPARLLQFQSILDTHKQTPVDIHRRSLFTKMAADKNLELLKDFFSDMGFPGITGLFIRKEDALTGPGKKRQRGLRNQLKTFINKLSVFQIEFLLSQLTFMQNMQELEVTDNYATEIHSGDDLSSGDGLSGNNYNKSPHVETAETPSNHSAQKAASVLMDEPGRYLDGSGIYTGVNNNISNLHGRDNSSADLTTEKLLINSSTTLMQQGEDTSDRNDGSITTDVLKTFTAMEYQREGNANADNAGNNVTAVSDTTNNTIKKDDNDPLSFSEMEKNQEMHYASTDLTSGLTGKSVNDTGKPFFSDTETTDPSKNEDSLIRSVGDNTTQQETQLISTRQNLAPDNTRNKEIQDAIAQIEARNKSMQEGRAQRAFGDADSGESITESEDTIADLQDGFAQSESTDISMTDSRPSGESQLGYFQEDGDESAPGKTGVPDQAQNELVNAILPDRNTQYETGEAGRPEVKLQNNPADSGIQTSNTTNESINANIQDSLPQSESNYLRLRDHAAAEDSPGKQDLAETAKTNYESANSGEPVESSNIRGKNLSNEQELNRLSYENQKERQIAFIMRKLHVTTPSLLHYLQKLQEKDLNELAESFKNHIRENRDRRKMIRHILDHPYLLKYNILDIFSHLSLDDEAGQEAGPGPSIKKQHKQKDIILSAYAKKIQLSQSNFLSFINKLSLKELVILRDIFQKEQFNNSQEKRILRKILYKLPAESILLINYLTALPEEEIKHLFSPADKTTAVNIIPDNKKTNVFYDKRGVEKIIVENAGLCLIANYLSGFFKRLGYLENKQFKNKVTANRALYIIQSMVTGKTKNPEYLLQLNKLLCGFEVDDPVIGNIRLTKKEIYEAENLLSSVIENWKQLKTTSLDGFRESFLQRKGILFEKETNWVLQVEKKGYDLLLNTIPWGFGLIRLPWMKKHIVVEW